jgi:membrane fusion protein (multidrug efflux system)
MMTKFLVWSGLAAAAFCLHAGWALSQPVSTAPPEVGYITASIQPVYDEQSYVGRIQSPQIVQLDARVTGYLEQQNFTDGDAVTKGQLLYVIEQPPYQAAVNQAQAALEQAQAQSGNANITLARAQALLRTPAGQQSTVDASKATALSDAAQIDVAKAQLQTAQINLGYTEIRSPIDKYRHAGDHCKRGPDVCGVLTASGGRAEIPAEPGGRQRAGGAGFAAATAGRADVRADRRY